MCSVHYEYTVLVVQWKLSGAGSYFHNLTALSCGHLHNPVLLSSTHHGTVSAAVMV